MKTYFGGEKLGTVEYRVRPHADIELGFAREELDYYVTLPSAGVTEETGVILTIPGFGGLADSVYQSEKLNPYLAEKYKCIVVSMNYFGIYRSMETRLDNQFIGNMERIYGVPATYWDDISLDSDFYMKVGELLERKGITALDHRCQALMITAREEYQSFGFLPALDCLTVLGEVLRKYPLANKKKIIAYGSSYGGYIAMLCGKFAPDTFSVIIDNSGFSRSEMKYIAGRELLESDFAVTVNVKNKSFTLPLAYNNPWTIMDETSPHYFGDSHKQIRNLLLREHRVKSNTRYYIFHCEEDQIASVADKDKVATLLNMFNPISYKRVGKQDIDGVLFKTYAHAMNASLRKLFDHVAEQDGEYGLVKESIHNEFTMNKTNSYNCGNKNYVFNFNDDYTMNVTITDNIKTDYNLIGSFEMMPQLLDICDSIDEALNYVVVKVSNDEYRDVFGVMLDIIEAFTAINLQINAFSGFLSKNDLFPNSEKLKNGLLKVIEHFNNENWPLFNSQLTEQVVPSFLMWKNEMHTVFSPYLTH
ncbi:hypothetical protein ABIE27_001262 [Paenibacillus sp. 4624]